MIPFETDAQLRNFATVVAVGDFSCITRVPGERRFFLGPDGYKSGSLLRATVTFHVKSRKPYTITIPDLYRNATYDNY